MLFRSSQSHTAAATLSQILTATVYFRSSYLYLQLCNGIFWTYTKFGKIQNFYWVLWSWKYIYLLLSKHIQFSINVPKKTIKSEGRSCRSTSTFTDIESEDAERENAWPKQSWLWAGITKLLPPLQRKHRQIGPTVLFKAILIPHTFYANLLTSLAFIDDKPW